MAGGAAAAAAIARAIKASGTIVRVDPQDFLWVLDRNPEPLVVIAQGGFLSRVYKYLTSYKGLAFYAESPVELELPSRCELVKASKIWIP